MLLNDELLKLPERFAEFVAEVRAFVESTNRRLERIESDVATLKDDVNVLKDDVNVLKQDVNVLKDDMGTLKGGHFESLWLRHAGGYLVRYGFVDVRPVDHSELYTKARAALSSGTIGQGDLEELLLADSLHQAERQSDGSIVYLTCEVSSRLHADDISRASRRADAVSRLDGTPGVAVAAGASIDDIAAALAEREGVTIVIPHSWRRSA